MTDDEIAACVAAARYKLATPVRRPPSPMRMLAAAALAAGAAVFLAGAVILGPGLEAKDTAPPTIFGER